jgi:capsular exopolysaccharide synthesis family protein
VSRIDDALRRKNAEGQPPEDSAPAQVFVPAWPAPGKLEGGQIPPGDLSPRPKARGMLSFSAEWRERLAGTEGDSHLVEQFRRLAATLHHAHQANGLRSVMVSSAAPGDGKTLTSVNLALVLAQSYRYNVLLIDADLRRPSIPTVLDLSDGSGLSEALRAPTETKLALVPITSRLTVLPAGRPIANSVEALTSPRMRQILKEGAARFDWVLLDGPPVAASVDARLLSQMVGGTLFVIHAGKTQCPDVMKAVEAIGREQIIGVVLNGVARDATDGHYYGPIAGGTGS